MGDKCPLLPFGGHSQAVNYKYVATYYRSRKSDILLPQLPFSEVKPAGVYQTLCRMVQQVSIRRIATALFVRGRGHGNHKARYLDRALAEDESVDDSECDSVEGLLLLLLDGVGIAMLGVVKALRNGHARISHGASRTEAGTNVSWLNADAGTVTEHLRPVPWLGTAVAFSRLGAKRSPSLWLRSTGQVLLAGALPTHRLECVAQRVFAAAHLARREA